MVKKILLLLIAMTVTALADEQTRVIQQTLQRSGLYAGPVDGNNNPELTAALRRYQISHGLEITGLPDSATIAALKTEPPPPSATPVNSPAAASASPAAASPPAMTMGDDQARVTQFLKDYLRDGEKNDLPPQMRYFAFPVLYFGHLDSTEEYVRRDTSGYEKRWPNRHYLLVEPISVARLTTNELKASFKIAYEVRTGKKTARGRSSNEVTLKDENGALRITSIGEKKLRD